MKSIYKMSLVALAVVGLTACNQEENIASGTAAQKQSYSVGASLGKYISEHIQEQEELGLPVERSLIVQGFEHGLNGTLKLTEEEMQGVLQSLDDSLRAKREAQAAEMANKAQAEGKAFLEANKVKKGVVTTESGLQYEVLQQGEGEKPAAEDTVEVHYVGTLIDGSQFDSSVDRGQPAKFPLNRVISGWTEGVQLMSVGSKYRFVIPSELAYGSHDTGSIPANSTLIFEVELLSIEKAADVK